MWLQIHIIKNLPNCIIDFTEKITLIFFREINYAIWQIFYAIELQPRVVANLYHKKIAKLHNRFHRKNHHKYKQFATTRGNNFFMI